MTEHLGIQPRPAGATSPVPARDIIAAVADLHHIAASLLTSSTDDTVWPDRIRALAQRLGELQAAAPDTVLYLLYFAAARKMERYSSHHALVCAATVKECAGELRCSDAEVRSLVYAALTMNLSITQLQDELVYREHTLTLAQRLAVERHPARSVEMLSRLGVTDGLWLDLVARHHTEPPVGESEEASSVEMRLAYLLRRVDVFSAKMSPRKTRKGLPPTLAVREAYLGDKGAPDPIGIAMTKAIGIYPPGSLVTLANGETALVLRRGVRASRPVVVSLIGSDRHALDQPILRLDADDGVQIRAAARIEDARCTIDHERLLSL